MIYNFACVVCKQMVRLPGFLVYLELIDLKIAEPHEQAELINDRLIEEHSQTFDEGLFLPYCKLYNKCI